MNKLLASFNYNIEEVEKSFCPYFKNEIKSLIRILKQNSLLDEFKIQYNVKNNNDYDIVQLNLFFALNNIKLKTKKQNKKVKSILTFIEF